MKIAIIGYGAEGRSNYRYFKQKYPEAEFTIFDQNPIKDAPVETLAITGESAFDQVSGFDLVLRSPGVAPRLIGQSDHHWSSTREFLRQCPAPIIGVTGSKGKGTTCSLISTILRAHFGESRAVHLVGNIGTPALDILPVITADDIVVYEMSSFQLWDVTQSPHVAVMTMLEPDHLNVHDNFDDYGQAKLNIFRFQQDGDTAVVGDLPDAWRERAEHMIEMNDADLINNPSEQGAHFDDSNLYFGERVICPASQVRLPGRHNLVNACAAIAATWEIIEHDAAAINTGLSEFTGLPHRLKFVMDVDGVGYYDDSIATTPGSAIAAIRAFDDPKILIVGGQDKGGDYVGLVEEIAQSNVRIVVGMGENGDKILQMINLREDQDKVLLSGKSMSEIVDQVHAMAEAGDVVIMSPAAASFDMFKSYVDRGEQYIAAVKNLYDKIES